MITKTVGKILSGDRLAYGLVGLAAVLLLGSVGLDIYRTEQLEQAAVRQQRGWVISHSERAAARATLRALGARLGAKPEAKITGLAGCEGELGTYLHHLNGPEYMGSGRWRVQAVARSVEDVERLRQRMSELGLKVELEQVKESSSDVQVLLWLRG